VGVIGPRDPAIPVRLAASHVPESKQPTGQARHADGPQPDAKLVLPALRQLLRDSLAGTPLQPLAQRLVEQLTAPGAPPDAEALLPASPVARTEAVRQALAWLVDNLGQPRGAMRCAELGPTVTALGVPAQRLETLGMLLLDAMRANVTPWRPEYEQAWRSTIGLVVRWIDEGAKALAYEPAFWVGIVLASHGGVVHVRTYLPYPCWPGQCAVVEIEPGVWGECPIVLADQDNVVALHLPAPRQPGDRIKLRAALDVGAGEGT
jgi:hypothetical protein